ncbi:MAG: 30S ribosomal protein S8 [Patescibacteria group bacterium]
MLTDTIADMLTRIRNASAVKKAEVTMPYSKLKFAIAQILKQEGYIKDVQKKEEKFGEISIALKYTNGQPAIRNIKRVSKTGRRIYVGKDHMPRVLNNLGIAIVSTSKGIMTNKQARKAGVGGEVICEIY